MGVSIHYRLALRPRAPDLDADYARWAVEDARTLALKMKRRGRFAAVTPIADDWKTRKQEGMAFVRYRHPKYAEQLGEVIPARGWIFVIDVGADCEPLRIGLCEYPAEFIHLCDVHRTRLRGWQLKAFSKTQYASLHGWEHFRRCHVAVVDFLAALRPLGFAVKISDEGGYWPRRSERTLREEVGLMNRVIAAAAGAMKDACGDDGGVEAPIFAHPQFERLEAEGVDLLEKQAGE